MTVRRMLGYAVAAAAVLGGSFAAAGSAGASVDRDCKDFATQEDAQAYFDSKGYSASNDPERLDSANGKGNGIACESRPRRAPQPDRGDEVVVKPNPRPDLRERFGAPDTSAVNAK